MKFEKVLKENKFTLVASLSDNNLDFAKAALDAGADAIKVHINVLHAASGHLFGDFAHNKDFLGKLVELAEDRPIGFVAGAADAYITPEERVEAEELGIDFVSCYAEHYPCFMLKSKKLTKMIALHDTYEVLLPAVKNSEIDVVEASIMHTSVYGTPLTYFDVLQYRRICEAVERPVLVPTQKKIQPDEVFALKDAGCKAVMIGAVVVGAPSADNWYNTTKQFRKEIDLL